MLQREELDAFIDQLYKDIEKGKALTWPWAASSGAVGRTWRSFCCFELSPGFRDWEKFLLGTGGCSPGPCEPRLLPLTHCVARASLNLWAGRGGWRANLEGSCAEKSH